MGFTIIYDKNENGGLNISLLDYDKVYEDTVCLIPEYVEYFNANKFEDAARRMLNPNYFDAVFTEQEKESLFSFARKIMEEYVIPIKKKWGEKVDDVFIRGMLI